MLTTPISEEDALEIARQAYTHRVGIRPNQPPKANLVKRDILRVQHYAIGSDDHMSRITLSLAGTRDSFWANPLNDIVHKASFAMHGGEEEGYIVLVEDILYFVAMDGIVSNYIHS